MKSFITFSVLLISSLSMSQQTTLENFQLEVGEKATILNNDYQFLAVTMDSRCPKDVTCVMAGWAMVEVQITQEGEAPYIKTVKVPADQDELVHPLLLKISTGVKVVIGKLSPYPISTEKFEDRIYSLEIWLVKEDQ